MNKYVPTGELQGDDKKMTDNGNSKKGDYNGSMGEASKSDLDNGYCNKTSIQSDTKSDKGKFA